MSRWPMNTLVLPVVANACSNEYCILPAKCGFFLDNSLHKLFVVIKSTPTKSWSWVRSAVANFSTLVSLFLHHYYNFEIVNFSVTLNFSLFFFFFFIFRFQYFSFSHLQIYRACRRMPILSVGWNSEKIGRMMQFLFMPARLCSLLRVVIHGYRKETV